MSKFHFEKGRHYDVDEVLEALPDLKLLRTHGQGPWQLSLYFDATTGIYLEKGPFGPWDAICFRVAEVMSPNDWNHSK